MSSVTTAEQAFAIRKKYIPMRLICFVTIIVTVLTFSGTISKRNEI